MKKIFVSLVIAASALACKKEGNNAGLMLTKIFNDGLIEQEYIYSQGQLVRDNTYAIGVGQSTLEYYRIYDYNPDGTPKTITLFGNNVPIQRWTFTMSAQGLVSRVDIATVWIGDDNLDNMDTFEEYQYNEKAQVIRVLHKRANQTLISKDEFSYDDAGNLQLWMKYLVNNGWVVYQKRQVQPSARQMPAHWKKFLVKPTDFYLFEHFAEKQINTSYNAGEVGTITTMTYANRTFNEQGYIISETREFKANGNTTTREYTYEYGK